MIKLISVKLLELEFHEIQVCHRFNQFVNGSRQPRCVLPAKHHLSFRIRGLRQRFPFKFPA